VAYDTRLISLLCNVSVMLIFEDVPTIFMLPL
jgi:hypothetical protein